MNNLVIDSESTLRLLIFISVFIILAILELIYPRRKLLLSKGKRWFVNMGVSAFNTVLVRAVIPLAGVAAAQLAQHNHWGLLNLIDAPAWFSILLFVVLFDLTIYFQHRLFHVVPILWRFHRMHHTDIDYDVTTGNRFHPVSILLSTLIKLGLVLLIGPLPVAIVIAEVLLNALAMFNHSNIRIPIALDKVLRKAIVTPDMHRVHHSVNAAEYSKNFGFNFPWWDRMFGTYIEQPNQGHELMKIGINGFHNQKSNNFLSLLLQPFAK